MNHTTQGLSQPWVNNVCVENCPRVDSGPGLRMDSVKLPLDKHLRHLWKTTLCFFTRGFALTPVLCSGETNLQMRLSFPAAGGLQYWCSLSLPSCGCQRYKINWNKINLKLEPHMISPAHWNTWMMHQLRSAVCYLHVVYVFFSPVRCLKFLWVLH